MRQSNKLVKKWSGDNSNKKNQANHQIFMHNNQEMFVILLDELFIQ